MKKLILMIVSIAAFVSVAGAEDKPVTFNQLPEGARTFLDTNYQKVKLVLATKDDDFIRPEFNVVLENGVAIQFDNDGRLEKIASRSGDIPAAVIPKQITDIVKSHYPDAYIVEYEVDRKTYEVKLSNRIEITFDSSFRLVEIDD
jgi:hypothetical protein